MLILFCIIVLVVGICGYFAWRKYKVYKLIKDIPTTPINHVQNGMAEIQGKVAARAEVLKRVLKSPMENKECVYYHFTVEEERRTRTRRSRSRYWSTVIDDEKSVNCAVDDNSGLAEVELLKATLVLDRDSRAREGLFSSAPAHLESMLNERYGRSTRGWVFKKNMRYTETVLEVGDPIYALGMAKRERDSVRITDGGPAFIVSDKGEKGMLSRYLWFTIGLSLVAITGVFLIIPVIMYLLFGD